jgi:hypothetical protein
MEVWMTAESPSSLFNSSHLGICASIFPRATVYTRARNRQVYGIRSGEDVIDLACDILIPNNNCYRQ